MKHCKNWNLKGISGKRKIVESLILSEFSLSPARNSYQTKPKISSSVRISGEKKISKAVAAVKWPKGMTEREVYIHFRIKIPCLYRRAKFRWFPIFAFALRPEARFARSFSPCPPVSFQFFARLCAFSSSLWNAFLLFVDILYFRLYGNSEKFFFFSLEQKIYIKHYTTQRSLIQCAYSRQMDFSRNSNRTHRVSEQSRELIECTRDVRESIWIIIALSV